MFLGAASGVGKTFAMLEEGRRLLRQGRDVVIGVVEAHGRPDILALAADFERVAATHPTGGGHLDTPSVIRRAPEVALVDELARTNPEGSTHKKRWQDVEDLLDAGIDVFSTLNVQNLESLNDVVFEITGIREQETIADHVVRRLADVELVDASPDGMQERLSAGKIIDAALVDAATGNYFRQGSLSALRELALSWTADRVDDALAEYRSEQGIEQPWQTRERIVVGLTGERGADIVIRRAARLALRSRAELVGVHIRSTRGAARDDRLLAEQRALLRDFGGEYHELVGDDVASALLAFAKAENATQIVLGTPRRARTWERFRPSPAMRVVREAGAIDVNLIPLEGLAKDRTVRWGPGGALRLQRRALAWLTTAAGLPLLTVLLLVFREHIALENVLLVYLLAAVGVGMIGGAQPAVVCAASGFLLANWYFTPPLLTWKIDDAGHLFSLFAFLLVASAVGFLVGRATRRSAEAFRARAQAEALAATTASLHPGLGTDASAVTRRIRDVFSMNAAAVLRHTPDGWERLAAVGTIILGRPEDATDVIPLTDDTVLALSGGSLTGDDRRVLRAFAAQMAQALERERLEREAAGAEALAETDRLRTALLDAVSHDLRTPLATIMASVTSLLETDVDWSREQTRAFLQAILDETTRLNRMVGRLLDASRVQAGAVHVFVAAVGIDEVVSSALAGLGVPADRVDLDIADSLPPVLTDPALAERAVANLIENAVAWSPDDGCVRVTAGKVADRIDLRIIDRGPGIDPTQRESVFQPFQRLGDAPRGAGVGLGMAVARGFLTAMGHELSIEDTPGGGTSMVISFRPARQVQTPSVETRAVGHG